MRYTVRHLDPSKYRCIVCMDVGDWELEVNEARMHKCAVHMREYLQAQLVWHTRELQDAQRAYTRAQFSVADLDHALWKMGDV